MPNHIERRRQLWYATLTVPPDVRDRLGKFKFIQSLGTPDRRRAEALAAPVIAGWRAQIRQARGETDAVTAEALRWRAALADLPADEHHAEAIELAASNAADNVEERHGEDALRKFRDIVTGNAVPSEAHFDAWAASIAHLKDKTRDQMQKDVRLLVRRFGTVQQITADAVMLWVEALRRDGMSDGSIARITSNCRSYWRYLQGPSVKAAARDAQPFAQLKLKRKRKKGIVGGTRRPFEAHDVVTLWKAAGDAGDQQLADLIMLGAYTGARIEELCSLKLEHLTAHRSLKVTQSKTDAGVREVPIHSAIQPLVQRLKRTSQHGHLLSGLSADNKYGIRSNGIGKRFGRLKSAHGYGKQEHTFHCIRATFITLLDNAGVPKHHAQDIVGHEKEGITYGTGGYSGGATLETKRKAIERVKYPLGRAALR